MSQAFTCPKCGFVQTALTDEMIARKVIEGKTYKEIGAELGVTGSRIQFRYKRWLGKLSECEQVCLSR